MTANDESIKTNKSGGKEKAEMTKIVLRRLPPGMSKDELFSQLRPFNSEPRAFWFCPGDMELRPHIFSRAYLAFHEEKDAVQFAERFNGYVLVDKLGNESMAIVELALNQSIPKSFLIDKTSTAKACDERCGTLTKEGQYLKFLDNYNQTLNSSTKRVIDFDGLVRQLEEKKRRHDEGQMQETPLTDYINKLSHEKGQKKQQKLVERNEKKKERRGSEVKKLDQCEDRDDKNIDRKTKNFNSKEKNACENKKTNLERTRIIDKTVKQTIDSKLEIKSKDADLDGMPITSKLLNDKSQDQITSTTAPRARGNKDRPERELYRPHAGKSLPKTLSKQPKTTVADKLNKRTQHESEKKN
ncbi:Smg4_UPF3 domain-containing protein [Meloidogyne graminicola]|uniref:Smg4_UPF3 domain-containing protein n=1 Tax=Meloidogyne graminicola TaxID=189291 RepID=A0A8S9ZIT1_9BILA|nr:Smg4_UPF3 domain-containing protein [Meloidogyne graminicola]